MNLDFIYKNNKQKYLESFRQNYQLNNDISYELVNDGLILPLVANDSVQFQQGGVIDSKGEFISNSLTKRISPIDQDLYFAPWFIGLKDQCISDFSGLSIIQEEVIFLGAMPMHYGHFLFEGTSRVWIKNIFDPKLHKFVFISFRRNHMDFLEFFECLGIPLENIFQITSPTKFKSIVIPEASIRLHDYYHKKFVNSVAVNRCNSLNSQSRKIFLRKSNKNSRAFGQKIIEHIMISSGFECIDPENYSMNEMPALLSNCSHLAASSGTNIHNSIFLPKGATSICFNRSSHLHPLQLMIDEMLELKSIYVDCHLNASKDNFSSGPYYFWPTKTLFRFISDMKIKANKIIIFLLIVIDISFYFMFNNARNLLLIIRSIYRKV